MIVGQSLGNAQRTQGDHRLAVGQAVPLIWASLVERESGVEVGSVLRKDIDVGIAPEVMNQGRGLPAPERAGSGKPAQDLREYLIRRHQAGCPEGTAKRCHASVERV